jgi:uncharacterized protein (DUF2126 family)/transglutaminase-like putative cysteine protease
VRVRLQHITRYHYEEGAALGPHTVRLAPAPHLASRVLSYNLRVTPEPLIRWSMDAWSNRQAFLTFPDRGDIAMLELQVDASFELTPVNPFDFTLDERCRTLPFAYPDGWAEELGPFLRTGDVHPAVRAWLAQEPLEGPVVPWLVALNARVARDIRYLIRNEPGIQAPEETLALASGSCRDTAWLLVHALRAAGLAARFVSGYLVQLRDDGNLPDVPRGMDRDVVDLHAWAEVFLPGGGWVGLDGTSGLLCTEGHIPLCATVMPMLAAPLTGTASGPADRFEFEMHVERIGHEPTPRRPYTDEQWTALRAAGAKVDATLAAHGVVLTSGGEPTWTSREHPRAVEWRTDALGPTKWEQGLRLAEEIRRRQAPGGVVVARMGKHYPGESLPRWALELVWRPDGTPVWRNPDCLALRPRVAAVAQQDAEALCGALHRALGIADAQPLEAWEDPWHAVTTEALLPVDADPFAVDLDSPLERRILANQLRRGLGRPTGWVTPLQWQQGRWQTQPWRFRRDRLYLLPGDSPVGLRLPLDRLAGTPVPLSPTHPWSEDGPLSGPLPVYQRGGPHGDATLPGAAAQQAGEVLPDPEASGLQIRTALCVEPRDGVLHVFLPPVPNAEAWLRLVDAVETAAEALDLPVRLEGYGPPDDSRLQRCCVTPDPGVLEVNLPPCTSLAAYADWLETLAEAAVHAGLTTETWQLDGRSSGSGGGNHLTLGGEHPDQSVFLQRPDVLASLVRFAQQHPSLSYLFTGLFVGPTSQAPRLDEARDDVLGEVELALSQLQRGGDSPPPWFIDRLLRNLLVDVTGNTHRTELCIDKLYNPGSLTGRLGIVELRAFEMPPHERMAVAQMLLVRALIAAFVQQPWTAPLVRWGSRLHDRFLLPWYLEEDLGDVLRFLEGRGLGLDPAFFAPFPEWRFPVTGRLEAEGLCLEIRPALEPWPVLGEEAMAGATSRYVDSSLDRVEVRVHGAINERHVVTVNGIRLPLRSTRHPEVRVAGVRFRAWQPPHCLQPHIGLHHPLHVDVVDTWARRSVAGCAWHVWHPEGRAFDEPPLTAFEAASRRASRFVTHASLPWPVTMQEPRWHPAGAATLDLRWSGMDRPQPWVEPVDP